MDQIRRLIAIMHGHHRQLGNNPGFPEIANRMDEAANSCSWRVTVLDVSLPGPFPSRSWKSPANQSQDTEVNRRLFSVKSRGRPSMYTQLFALSGPGTAFTEFAVGKERDTKDAEPDAILLLDAKNHLIHWMEPGDIDVETLKWSRQGLGNLRPNYPEGFIVGFVDGQVWFIRRDVPTDVIAPFFTLEGAGTHDRDEVLAPYVIDKMPSLPKLDGNYVLPES